MTIKRLLNNKIFLTFLILGMIEPRCVGELAECFFNKLKVFRRFAIRYDKLAVSSVAFIHL